MPEARLIYVVRHPIERMKSHYVQLRVLGLEGDPIEKALAANPVYLSSSRYASQIEHYLEHFAREQLLVITAEQLRSERQQTLRRVLTFLGVECDLKNPILQREFNTTETKRIRRSLFQAVAHSALYRTLKRLTPAEVRYLAHPLITRRPTRTMTLISDDLERRLTDELRGDVRRLHRYVEGSFDGWGIEGK
jgi:hypothetical protein